MTPAARGLTLVELLFALVLLGSVTVAASAWLRLSAETSTSIAEPLRWRSAAEATCRLIADDLAAGDFDAEEPSVAVHGDALVIHSRADGVGAIAHHYIYDTSTQRLERQTSGAGGIQSPRPLLADVAHWSCQVERDEGGEPAVLHVEIGGAGEQLLVRALPLP